MVFVVRVFFFFFFFFFFFLFFFFFVFFFSLFVPYLSIIWCLRKAVLPDCGISWVSLHMFIQTEEYMDVQNNLKFFALVKG